MGVRQAGPYSKLPRGGCSQGKNIYATRTGRNNKDAECVKQGLYSKCFLAAVPCRPKP